MCGLLKQVNEQRDPCRKLGLFRPGLEYFIFGYDFVPPLNQRNS